MQMMKYAATIADLRRQIPELEREAQAAADAARRAQERLIHARAALESLVVLDGVPASAGVPAAAVVTAPAASSVASAEIGGVTVGARKLDLLDAIDMLIREAHAAGKSIKSADVHARLQAMDDRLVRPRPALATVRSAMSEAHQDRGWTKVGGGSVAAWTLSGQATKEVDP